MQVTAMKTATLLLATALATQMSSASTPAPAMGSAQVQEIQRTLLVHLVTTRCQKRTCVPTVRERSIDSKLLASLAKKGSVAPLRPGDFLVKDGATGAFRRINATILDLGDVQPVDSSTARVVVHELSTALSRKNCIYIVRRVSGAWAVDDGEAICSS